MTETRTIASKKELETLIHSGQPVIFCGSRTSTVIPFHREIPWQGEPPILADLSAMPATMDLGSDGQLRVGGGIRWEQAMAYCRARNREIMTAPTEVNACVLAGAATSATGERCFGFGTLRDQIGQLVFMDARGREITLDANQPLADMDVFASSEASEVLTAYQAEYDPYLRFKNAPFPRMQQATDLLVGTEGQLGAITELVINTAPHRPTSYLLIQLCRWEEDFAPHLAFHERVQSLRGKILACELLDWNSLAYLSPSQTPFEQRDLIFLEVLDAHMDDIVAELLEPNLPWHEEDVFVMEARRFHEMREAVPRAIADFNARRNVTKRGTDVQVTPARLSDLLKTYQEAAQLGIQYCLYGHFGDAHLHFNFRPQPDELSRCDTFFTDFYGDVKAWGGSPFAEHGIGLVKQPYVGPFHGATQFRMFDLLKQTHDPHRRFFPQGFMSRR